MHTDFILRRITQQILRVMISHLHTLQTIIRLEAQALVVTKTYDDIYSWSGSTSPVYEIALGDMDRGAL